MSSATRMSPNSRRLNYLYAPGRIYGHDRRLTARQYRRLVKKSKGSVVRVKVGKRLQAVSSMMRPSVPA